MSTLEEQLWNYIDGNCNATEKAEIEAKIASNLQYQEIYQELLAVNQELNTLDFEEPSLSFTRNVMEQVKLEIPPVTLKTKVDNRIIYSIGAFFIISILGIFGYVISISDLSFTVEMPKFNFSFPTDKIFSPTFLQIFILFDVALALIYLDSFLRKRHKTESEKQ